LQTSAQVFVIKWARAKGAAEGPAYLASTVVLWTEVVKTAASFILVAVAEGGVSGAWKILLKHFTRSYVETLRMSVPSLMYTIQNNLMFFSLLKLSAAVQQVTYQLKILTTALLSVMILGKALGATRWSALLLLLSGVLLVQWPRGHDSDSLSSRNSSAGVDLTSLPPPSQEVATLGFGIGLDSDAAMGFLAVLAACFTSGFASVYLEKLLKETDASIWVRNVQLGAFGSLMALVVAATQDGSQILEGGFTQGYSLRTVCVILTNALGGLLCAAVLKYADNILRCFSTALSIVLTCVLSATILNEYTPDMQFVLGASLAISALFLYSLGLPKALESKTFACKTRLFLNSCGRTLRAFIAMAAPV